jgi:AAA+ superfamily predicted ATPase
MVRKNNTLANFLVNGAKVAKRKTLGVSKKEARNIVEHFIRDGLPLPENYQSYIDEHNKSPIGVVESKDLENMLIYPEEQAKELVFKNFTDFIDEYIVGISRKQGDKTTYFLDIGEKNKKESEQKLSFIKKVVETAPKSLFNRFGSRTKLLESIDRCTELFFTNYKSDFDELLTSNQRLSYNMSQIREVAYTELTSAFYNCGFFNEKEFQDVKEYFNTRLKKEQNLVDKAKDGTLFEDDNSSKSSTKNERAKKCRSVAKGGNGIKPVYHRVTKEEPVPELTVQDDKYMTSAKSFLKKRGITFLPQNSKDATLEHLIGYDDNRKDEALKPFRKQILAYGERPDKQTVVVHMDGPPGMGKTYAAEAIANTIKAGFISVKPTELLNKYVGVPQERLEEKFEFAIDEFDRTGKVQILFFDEAAKLFPDRGSDSKTSEYFVPTFNIYTDGTERHKLEGKVVVMLATNHANTMDKAVLSRGRHIKWTDSPAEDYANVLVQHTVGNFRKTDFKNIDWTYLGKKAKENNISFRNLTDVVGDAKEYALKEIGTKLNIKWNDPNLGPKDATKLAKEYLITQDNLTDAMDRHIKNRVEPKSNYTHKSGGFDPNVA